MNEKTFLATTGQGIALASPKPQEDWSVEFVLVEQDVRCLAADPHHSNVVYAGTQGNGLWRSSDRGKTWQPAGLAGRPIKSTVISRTAPGVMYAGTKSPPSIFVSHDGGAHWMELEAFRKVRRWYWFSPAEPPFTAYVQDIALSPSDPNVIVVGIEAGAVVRSDDGGQAWEGHRPGALRDCHSLTFHATKGDWVYEGGGSGAGAAFSRDGGKTWKQPKAGLDRHYGWAVAADPAQPEVWYASLSPGALKAHSQNNAQACIFRSVGGAAWKKLSGGLPQPLNSMPYALITDPAAPGHLYVGLSNGDVWHSADHGETWAQLPFNLKGIQRVLIVI